MEEFVGTITSLLKKTETCMLLVNQVLQQGKKIHRWLAVMMLLRQYKEDVTNGHVKPLQREKPTTVLLPDHNVDLDMRDDKLIEIFKHTSKRFSW